MVAQACSIEPKQLQGGRYCKEGSANHDAIPGARGTRCLAHAIAYVRGKDGIGEYR
jgi:hypothetical protein